MAMTKAKPTKNKIRKTLYEVSLRSAFFLCGIAGAGIRAGAGLTGGGGGGVWRDPAVPQPLAGGGVEVARVGATPDRVGGVPAACVG